MGKIIALSDFEKDIQAYKEKEQEVARTFVLGVRDLGEILLEQREKWKPHGRWGEYLEQIGRSQAWANQCVRLYEYSKTNMKALMNADLSNWRRVNDFIALPDKAKKEVSKRIAGEDVSNDEFNDVVDDVKEDIEEDISRTPREEERILESLVLPKSVQKTIEGDMGDTAKDILKDMQEQNDVFTKASEGFVESLLHINLGVKELAKLSENNKLSDDEKKYWKRTISLAAKALKDISTKVGAIDAEESEDEE